MKQVFWLQGVCDYVFAMQSGSSARSRSSQPRRSGQGALRHLNWCGGQAVLVWRHSPRRIFGCDEGSRRRAVEARRLHHQTTQNVRSRGGPVRLSQSKGAEGQRKRIC